MNFYIFLSILFIAEIVIVLSLLILLIFKRISIHYEEQDIAEEKKVFSQFLQECLKTKNLTLSTLRKKISKNSMIAVLESFENRFKGGDWEVLKNNIVILHLLPSARKWAKSFFWTKRNLSARCFLLTPLIEDQHIISKLIDDSKFLVRSIAAIAGVKLCEKKIINKVIDHLGKEEGYAHYFYRDILLKGSKKIFPWIEERASHTKNTKVLLACLEILSEVSMPINPSILDKSLHSKDDRVVLAAVKVFSQNPQKQSDEVLISLSHDQNEEVREQVALGLRFRSNKQNVKQLEELLDDSSPTVRMQAAKSLKQCGKIGIAILNQQDQKKHKLAFDAAQEAIEFE